MHRRRERFLHIQAERVKSTCVGDFCRLFPFSLFSDYQSLSNFNRVVFEVVPAHYLLNRYAVDQRNSINRLSGFNNVVLYRSASSLVGWY